MSSSSDASAIPSLGEHLAGKPIEVGMKGRGRVHRIMEDETDPRIAKPREPAKELRKVELEIAARICDPPVDTNGVMLKTTPFNPTKGEAMPNKAKTPAAAAPAGEKKLKRKYTKKIVAKKAHPVGAATFVVNDSGHMSIMEGQQRIDLERADVVRLVSFLERTKGIRA